MFINTVTTILQGVLLSIDTLLSFLYYPWKFLARSNTTVVNNSENKMKTIIIVGGSFGGLTALRHLLHGGTNIRIILIDQRNYYEYIPGILRLFCNPDLYYSISRQMPTLEKPHKFVHGKCKTINKDNVIVQLLDGSNTTITISYDHLIIATGANYGIPITPTENEASMEVRHNSWRDQATKLKASKSVLVLGGGAVGTELAAEIVCHFPEKKVTVVDGQKTLVPLFPESTQKHVEKWFLDRNTRLVLGEMLEKIDKTGCTLTKSGERIDADIVFVCFGMKCNTHAVLNGDMSTSLNERGAIVVNQYLQLEQFPHVFAVGDVMVHPASEIKQAYYAEMNGAAAAANILALVNGEENLFEYPKCIADSPISPLVYVVSLGRYDGSLGFNNLILNGKFAAIVKWILEFTKIKQMEERPIGLAVWTFGDAFSFWLSKNILRPSQLSNL